MQRVYLFHKRAYEPPTLALELCV
uniref:Uncharacterized protein n=1 Tax=Anguilla anguilla TaxID=7936 RepID=A0A0E9QGU8_ANGAN